MTCQVIDRGPEVRHAAHRRAADGSPDKRIAMTAYAVGLLTEVDINDDIVEYLDRIDATLEPFGGRFVVHGGKHHVFEGDDPGTLIVIGFDDLDAARSWYDSDGYQRILGLRTANAKGAVFLVDGVSDGHRAPDVLGHA
jgi:uncharacterized protein (DUF1330 family)